MQQRRELRIVFKQSENSRPILRQRAATPIDERLFISPKHDQFDVDRASLMRVNRHEDRVGIGRRVS